MPGPLSDVVRAALEPKFTERWKLEYRDLYYPWWRRPATCRILMYGDGGVALAGGPFQGLTYVKTLLELRPYPYVKFVVDFCHRNGTDPSATVSPGVGKKLTELDIMNNYDEIWLFGIAGGASLDANEVALMDQFMAAPKFGGVLTTGDHENLGKGLSGPVTRAGQMRQYPAPPNDFPVWNTTLETGANASYEFDDQSDDVPQYIRLKYYPTGVLRSRPHQLLCGPDGPINVFPDHQHEGEALAPVPVSSDARWPKKNGHQEAPEVIAWGLIKDPSATKAGQEIGLISAYNGHRVDVGRISADSTWHHWFDINLIGIAGSTTRTGFDDTPAGQAALKQIDAYFLNTGVWLAPPAVQTAMRNAAWWNIIWADLTVELTETSSLRTFGLAAMDALGRNAPRCLVFDTVWPKEPIYKPKIPWWEWIQLVPELDLVDIPVEQFMAGGILRELAQTFGHLNSKRTMNDKPPGEEEIARAIAKGTEAGLALLGETLKRDQAIVGRLVEAQFQPGKLADKRPR